MEFVKWFGCCLVIPVTLLFLMWPFLLLFFEFSKITVYLVALGWYSILIGTSIYFYDKHIG